MAGAVTWSNGSTGITGPVSASNSLVGTAANDNVGSGDLASRGIVALSNGNYVVSSPAWNNGAASQAGAATWGNGSHGITGPVSTGNSLVGTAPSDTIGSGGVAAESDGNYVVLSDAWNGGRGAVTLANGAFRLKGTVQSWNSVLGTASNGGSSLTYAYDATRHTLIVGRPADNVVSLFTMDQIFAGDFEQ